MMAQVAELELGESVEDWYRQHYDGLARLAMLATGDPVAAEDAVQEVFAECLRRPPRLEGPPLPYLRAAVLNRSRSRARRTKRGEELHLRVVTADDAVTPSPEAKGLLGPDAERIAEAVRALPRRQRDVILLRFWLDLSEAEIAETLGVSPGTVKSSASRARAALAPVLEGLR